MFSVLKPLSEQVHLCFTVSFYRERFRNNFFCVLVVSPLTPPHTLALPHSVLFVPHNHHPPRSPHLLSFLLPVMGMGMPLPEFSHPLDVSVYLSSTEHTLLHPLNILIFLPFPHVPTTQSQEHCPGIYFCAHKMAIPGDLLLCLPLK